MTSVGRSRVITCSASAHGSTPTWLGACVPAGPFTPNSVDCYKEKNENLSWKSNNIIGRRKSGVCIWEIINKYKVWKVHYILTLIDSDLRQAWLLHPRLSVSKPGQGRPPFAGAGLLHARLLLMVPPPHDSEHAFQLVQSFQIPLIAIKRIMKTSAESQPILLADKNQLSVFEKK